MAGEIEPKKIMTKPLPQILDEIEDSIKLADTAAKDARRAADDARKAGDKAASEATKAATQAIADIKQTADNAMRLAELLNLAIKEAVVAIEKRLSEKP
jgi:hypothetical protein